MSESKIQHPAPHASWETHGYWEGTSRGELVLQRCTACGTVQHKPRGICVSCYTGDIEHFVASGRGTVYTFTVTNQNQARGFADAVPYVMAYIDLDEGVRVLSNIVGCDPETVTIGMTVQVEFAAVEDSEYAVPRFVPAAASDASANV